jgi:hypothetical protein
VLNKTFLALLFPLAGSLAASAATLVPISYSMPNGGYDFIAGYGDNTYNSSNCPDCPVFLSGGLGELTDGITSPGFFAYPGSFGPMVGWFNSSPTIEVFFDGPQSFGSVGLHLSNAHGAAGIGLPSTVTIAGNQVFSVQSQNDYPDTSNEWQWFDLASGTTGSSLTIRLDAAYQWTFMDEMSFLSADEVSGVPEPGTIALAISGLGLVAGLKRCRK